MDYEKKQKIADKIETEFNGYRDYALSLLDYVDDYQDDVVERFLLKQFQLISITYFLGFTPYIESDGDFQGKNYYLNISKSVFLAISILAVATDNKEIAIGEVVIKEVYPDCISPAKILSKLNGENAENCILVEALRSRKKGKKGLEVNHYDSFCGECINNHLNCGKRLDQRCKIGKSDIEAVVEKGYLRKKGGRYYYTDWF